MDGESWEVRDSLDVDIAGPVDQIAVRIVSGEVTVTPGEVAHVEVHRESGADVMVEVRNGALRISQPDADSAPISRFFQMLASGRRHRCTVAVTAPSSVRVEVSTVSAPVVASGFEAGANIKTVSGDVTLANLGTEVNVKTISGDVDAKHIKAELKLKSVSGDLAVVDGSCRFVDTKTVSGDILLDLDLDNLGTYDATTVSGDVSLRTTAEPNLSIDAKTVSGSFISDFGGNYDERPGKRTIRYTIGDGGARLWVKTVSGNLRVLGGREAAA